MTRYRTIVADPPWSQPSGGPYGGSGHRWANHGKRPSALPYPTMTVPEIEALTVPADRDAHLYLWTTNANLEAAYRVARAWDFRPIQVLVWAKTPRGIGLGGAFTNTAEFVLFCRRGTLAAQERQDTSWWHWTRPHNDHSAKPEAFMDLVERVSPAPRLEMFSRRARLGWDTWGNESLHGGEAA